MKIVWFTAFSVPDKTPSDAHIRIGFERGFPIHGVIDPTYRRSALKINTCLRKYQLKFNYSDREFMKPNLKHFLRVGQGIFITKDKQKV